MQINSLIAFSNFSAPLETQVGWSFLIIIFASSESDEDNDLISCWMSLSSWTKSSTVSAWALFINKITTVKIIDNKTIKINHLKNKINIAKPEAKVTTPSTAALNALKKMNIILLLED